MNQPTNQSANQSASQSINQSFSLFASDHMDPHNMRERKEK